MGNVCENCDKKNSHKRCERCKAPRYCSRECQVEHWKVHKKNCFKPVKCSPLKEEIVEITGIPKKMGRTMHMAAFYNDKISIMVFFGLNYQHKHDTLQLKNKVASMVFKLNDDLHYWKAKGTTISGYNCVRGEIIKDDKVLSNICSCPGEIMYPIIYRSPIHLFPHLPLNHCQTRSQFGNDYDISEEKSTLALTVGKITNTKPGVEYELVLKTCSCPIPIFFDAQSATFILPKDMNKKEEEIIRIKFFY
jgi:hypothetical protein